MTYVPTTGGHAPNDLRDAFLSLLEGYASTKLGETIPDVILDDAPIEPSVLAGGSGTVMTSYLAAMPA